MLINGNMYMLCYPMCVLPCIAVSFLGLLSVFASPVQLFLFCEWSDISIHGYQSAFLCGFTNTEHQTIISAAGCKQRFFYETRSPSRDMTDSAAASQPLAVCHADGLGSVSILFCYFLAGVKNQT